MTATDRFIAELRALIDKATPGPWSHDQECIVGQIPGGRPGGEVFAQARPSFWRHYEREQNEANAAYIARLDPATVRLLLDVVERAQKVRSLESAKEYKPTELEAATFPPESFTTDGFVPLRHEHKAAFRSAAAKVMPALDALEAHLKERAK